MRNTRLIVLFAALLLIVAACGGQSAEEELVERIIESGGEDIGNVDIDTGGDGDFNMTIEGEDGENISISGGGEGDDFSYTVEGEDGESFTIGGGEIPEGLTIPVPEGGDVSMSMSSGGDKLVSLQYPLSEFDRLVAFYDSTFDIDSDAVDRNESTMSTEDGTFRNVFWSDAENYDWNVTVGDCFIASTGAPDAVCVNINESGD